jgi:formylglycine-generating enzyme required for sulfatase activity
MNRLVLLVIAGAVLNGLMGTAGAVILPPTDDTSGTLTYNTAKPPVVTKRSLTSLNGSGTTLPVSKTRTAFVRFEVEGTGMTAGTVDKARLTLYFPSVTKAGNLNLHVVTQDWEETFSGPTRTHPTFGASFLTIPLASVIKKQFVIVDVTQQVKEWLTTPGSNFGIAVTSPDGIGNVTIGSKEGSASGYPPLLEMEGTGATSDNTANAIVKRDGDGNFMVGTITGALVGNATSATTAGSATDFTGALAGDVTGTQDATAIASPTVTGKVLTGFATTAGSISATDTLLTAINKLDGNLALRAPLASPSFTGTVLFPAGTASAASLRLQSGTNLTSPEFGVVEFDGTNLFLTTNDAFPTRKTIAFTDSAITSGQIPDAAITAPKLATGAVGSSQLASDLILGGLTTGTFTGTLNGAATTAGSFTGSLSGDVTGTQGSTTVATINGISAANIAAGANLANAATTANTPNTIVKRDASGNIPGVTPALTPPPGMVLIDAGAFTMGDSLDGLSDAVPISTTVSAFYMDVNEVTASKWQVVQQWAKDNGYTDLRAGTGKGPNHPVFRVSWYDCVKWCNARSEFEGKTPVYFTDDGQTTIYRTGNVNVTNAQVRWTGSGYRMPTEAEWEKAARGGMVGKRFPWGDTITLRLANYYSSIGLSYDEGGGGGNLNGSMGSEIYTNPVGSFAPNGYGLNDVAGNAWEWCWDWYGTWYSGGTDPKGPINGSNRIIRGGGWANVALFPRCAHREQTVPTDTSVYGVSLRAVLSAGQ